MKNKIILGVIGVLIVSSLLGCDTPTEPTVLFEEDFEEDTIDDYDDYYDEYDEYEGESYEGPQTISLPDVDTVATNREWFDEFVSINPFLEPDYEDEYDWRGDFYDENLPGDITILNKTFNIGDYQGKPLSELMSDQFEGYKIFFNPIDIDEESALVDVNEIAIEDFSYRNIELRTEEEGTDNNFRYDEFGNLLYDSYITVEPTIGNPIGEAEVTGCVLHNINDNYNGISVGLPLSIVLNQLKERSMNVTRLAVEFDYYNVTVDVYLKDCKGKNIWLSFENVKGDYEKAIDNGTEPILNCICISPY